MDQANDNKLSRQSRSLKKIKDALLEGSRAETGSSENSESSGAGDVFHKSINLANGLNISGNGNSIHITVSNPPFAPFSPPPEKVLKQPVIVKTGDGVLTAQQKAKINALFKEWAQHRAFVRKTPSEIRELRGAFNAYMRVNKYDEILQEDFEKALRWIYRQTGIVKSMASARSKNPNWRVSRYKAINARAKEFTDGEQRYRQYAQENFGSASLKDLNDDALEAVYRYVFGWKRATKL